MPGRRFPCLIAPQALPVGFRLRQTQLQLRLPQLTLPGRGRKRRIPNSSVSKKVEETPDNLFREGPQITDHCFRDCYLISAAHESDQNDFYIARNMNFPDN